MSPRFFCVDGTNLVRTAYGYGGPAHAAQEDADGERVVRIFAALCEELEGAAELELFFDGAFRVMPGPRPANFRLSFARDSSADELILDRVRAGAWRGGVVTVATADGGLGRAVEAEGGRWLKVVPGTDPERVARRIGGRFADR